MPLHPDVRVERSERLSDGRYKLDAVTFRARRFDGAWGQSRRWELWRRGRAVAVLPYDPRRDVVVLIEQIRLAALAAGLPPLVTELCAGFVEPGEDLDAVVRREALEETGLVVGRVERLGGALLAPGGTDEYCDFAVAEVTLAEVPDDGILGHAGLAEENEDIRVNAVSAERAIDDARAGRQQNAVYLIGLLLFAGHRERLRADWA